MGPSRGRGGPGGREGRAEPEVGGRGEQLTAHPKEPTPRRPTSRQPTGGSRHRTASVKRQREELSSVRAMITPCAPGRSGEERERPGALGPVLLGEGPPLWGPAGLRLSSKPKTGEQLTLYSPRSPHTGQGSTHSDTVYKASPQLARFQPCPHETPLAEAV